MNKIRESSKGLLHELHVVEQAKAIPSRPAKGHVNVCIGPEIRFDPRPLDAYCYEGWRNIHYDLLLLCAAVEYADRRWGRGAVVWARNIHVDLPVLELDTWLDSINQELLIAALCQVTGDNWGFSFRKWEGPFPYKSHQRPLFEKEGKKLAIAYSDGLDSRCVSELFNKDDVAVLVRVAKDKLRLRDQERPFDRLPFSVKVNSACETSARSRGFKFATISAIAAQLSKVSLIIVPESGQGALGPVLHTLLHVYPDYRNHPIFFRRMELFIQSLLGLDVRYEQPRLWSTKGETISEFLALPKTSAEQLIDTRSCWQQRHNVHVGGKRRQCGICAACLLRRMSLHAAELTEPSDTYAISDLNCTSFEQALKQHASFKASNTLVAYGCAGVRHLSELAALASHSEDMLRSHASELSSALGCPTKEVLLKLRSLLQAHEKEWMGFLSSLDENSFLLKLAIGEYDARSK